MVKMIKARELDPELAAFVVESCGGMGPFLRNAIHCVNPPESGTLKSRMKLVWQILGACTEEERPEMVALLCPELRLQVFLADQLAAWDEANQPSGNATCEICRGHQT